MPSIPVHVKHAGKVHDLQINTDLPALAFKESIYQVTGVPVERMKVMVKGGILKVCFGHLYAFFFFVEIQLMHDIYIHLDIGSHLDSSKLTCVFRMMLTGERSLPKRWLRTHQMRVWSLSSSGCEGPNAHGHRCRGWIAQTTSQTHRILRRYHWIEYL